MSATAAAIGQSIKAQVGTSLGGNMYSNYIMLWSVASVQKEEALK